MTRRYHFVQVDVFTHHPFGGNQLAVFTDARGLTTADMQNLTREMNFSESSFVLPPEVDGAVKRVRIFTPRRELPMAGHPTVGTTFVLAQRGELPLGGQTSDVILQLGIGPTRVTVERREEKPAFVWMTQRSPEFGTIRHDHNRVAQALGIEPDGILTDYPMQIVSTGVPFLIVPVRSLEVIARCRSDADRLAGLFTGEPFVDLLMFTTETVSPATQVHTRMFSPHVSGIAEDAATGGAAGPLGGYLVQHGILPRDPCVRFVEEQGIEMGRPSQIHVEIECSTDAITGVRVGGDSVIVGEGDIFWD